MRLFVALSIPDAVAQSLMLIQGGVPGARWQAREQLHLTLRFIGEVDGRDADAIDDALASIEAPDFTLQLHGVGQFGNAKPNSLWAGVRPGSDREPEQSEGLPARPKQESPLEHLARKVDSAIRRVGAPPSSGDKYAHKFMPHVTLARMNHPDMEKVMDWLKWNALYTSAEFRVEEFRLYSSHLRTDGSLYAVEEDYPLGGHDEIDD